MAGRRNFVEVGAAWNKPTSKGDVFISVSMKTQDGETLAFNLFPNKYKTEVKQPDFRVSMDDHMAETMGIEVKPSPSPNRSKYRKDSYQAQTAAPQSPPAPQAPQAPAQDSKPAPF